MSLRRPGSGRDNTGNQTTYHCFQAKSLPNPTDRSLLAACSIPRIPGSTPPSDGKNVIAVRRNATAMTNMTSRTNQ